MVLFHDKIGFPPKNKDWYNHNKHRAIGNLSSNHNPSSYSLVPGSILNSYAEKPRKSLRTLLLWFLPVFTNKLCTNNNCCNILQY